MWRRSFLALTPTVLQAQPACPRPLVVPLAEAHLGHPTVSHAFAAVLRERGARLGCRFEFPQVPRARLELMLATAQADVLMPATRTPERERHASFVSLASIRPELVWWGPRGEAPASTLAQLATQSELRGVFVRGQSWGLAYERLLDPLQRERRIDLVGDLATVLRMLAAGRADFTLIAPDVMRTAFAEEAELLALVGQLRFAAMPDLPAIETGAFVSRRRLSEAERLGVEHMLREVFDPATVKQMMERRAAAVPALR